LASADYAARNPPWPCRSLEFGLAALLATASDAPDRLERRPRAEVRRATG